MKEYILEMRNLGTYNGLIHKDFNTKYKNSKFRVILMEENSNKVKKIKRLITAKIVNCRCGDVMKRCDDFFICNKECCNNICGLDGKEVTDELIKTEARKLKFKYDEDCKQ